MNWGSMTDITVFWKTLYHRKTEKQSIMCIKHHGTLSMSNEWNDQQSLEMGGKPCHRQLSSSPSRRATQMVSLCKLNKWETAGSQTIAWTCIYYIHLSNITQLLMFLYRILDLFCFFGSLNQEVTVTFEMSNNLFVSTGRYRLWPRKGSV